MITTSDVGLSINHAITVAPEGGTVEIGPGLWNQEIDFSGRAITVRSAAGSSATETILDGSNLENSVVRFTQGENGGSILRGFTIRNGTAGSTSDGVLGRVGGAIYVEDGFPVIEECILIDNQAGHGGAIYALSGGPTIRDCTFITNGATGDGGAVMIVSSDALVEGCLFEGNFALEQGGALRIHEGSTLVEDCTITGGMAAYGGGVRSSGTSGQSRISRCDIDGNTSNPGTGGGVDVAPDANALEVIDTTICNNTPRNLDGPVDDLGGNTICDCAEDINGDGRVDGADLSIMLGAWGTCAAGHCIPDIDGDGVVGGLDMALLLGSWGFCD